LNAFLGYICEGIVLFEAQIFRSWKQQLVADTNDGTVEGEVFGIKKSERANQVTFDKCRFVHRVISANIRNTCSGFELVVGR